MATINVEHSHNLGTEEALKRAHDLVKDLSNKLNAQVNWSGNNASFKGNGFSGHARVAEHRVAVDLDLALMLRPMKGKIESRIEKALQEKFA